MRAPDIMAALGWHTEQCFLYIAVPFEARSAIPGEEINMKTKKKTALDTIHFITEELLPCSQNTHPRLDFSRALMEYSVPINCKRYAILKLY